MTRRSNTLERRDAITGAMIRLLGRGGLEAATISALARETGLTQGLIHYHFASKDEVVLAAVERLAAGIDERVKAALPTVGASGQPLGALVAALLGTGTGDEEALRAWLAVGDAAGKSEPVRLLWAGALARSRAQVAGALPVGGRPGADAETLAGMVVAVVEGAWRVGVLAPGLIPAGTAAGVLAGWLGTGLPVLPAPAVAPVSTPSGPAARGRLPPPRLSPADLGIRLGARERRWLDRVMARAPVAVSASLWQAVAAAYTSPGRHYHTLEHLAELADRYAEVAAGPGWIDPDAAWSALLFHDAVYTVDVAQPHGENERRSAALLLALVPGAAAAAELILATAGHGGTPAPRAGTASPRDLAHFLDADLSILGASPARFARYGRQVAAEYIPALGADLYAVGRSAFVRGMLDAPSIFHSDWFRARFEAAARRNLQTALAG